MYRFKATEALPSKVNSNFNTSHVSVQDTAAADAGKVSSAEIKYTSSAN